MKPIKKIVLIYGLIAGAIVAAMMFVTMPLYHKGILTSKYGELVGYTTMIVAFAPTIFIAIKSYRDNYLSGLITFWGGVKIGLLITLIASVMYALAWEICYHTIMPDFVDKMAQAQHEKMVNEGKSAEEIAKSKEKMTAFVEMYRNPVIRFSISLMEIAPVGIAITLLSAGLLRRREFLPATT